MEPWNLKCEAWNLGSMVPWFHFFKNRVEPWNHGTMEPWNHGTQMCIMSNSPMFKERENIINLTFEQYIIST